MHTSVIGPGSVDNWEGLGEISPQWWPSLQRYGRRIRGAALFSMSVANFNQFPFRRNRSTKRPKLDSIVGGIDTPIHWGDFRRKNVRLGVERT